MRIAILDLYRGEANEGMRCIRQLAREWGSFHGMEVELQEFEVRNSGQLPDLSFDAYISSGGPGSPFDGEGQQWEADYFNWIRSLADWNGKDNGPKKPVFFICHSFQMACRYFDLGQVKQRKSTSFGVFPVHVTPAGQEDPLFSGLNDPFYVVDSRDWQVVEADVDELGTRGMTVLAIEKYRPHVPLAQAVMAARFNPWMAGTQFHPEADAIGMSMYLQRPDKKAIVTEQHGEDKWSSMVEQLADPEKIMWTYSHLLPNFLDQAHRCAAVVA